MEPVCIDRATLLLCCAVVVGHRPLRKRGGLCLRRRIDMPRGPCRTLTHSSGPRTEARSAVSDFHRGSDDLCAVQRLATHPGETAHPQLHAGHIAAHHADRGMSHRTGGAGSTSAEDTPGREASTKGAVALSWVRRIQCIILFVTYARGIWTASKGNGISRAPLLSPVSSSRQSPRKGFYGEFHHCTASFLPSVFPENLPIARSS